MFKSVKKAWLSAVCFCLGLQCVLAENSSNHPPLVRLNSVLRLAVENRDGKAIGSIRGIALDPTRGTVRFVLVGSDGLFGGRAVRPVPPELVSPSTAKRGIAAVHVGPLIWQGAPVMKMGDIASMSDPAQLEQVRRHYGISSGTSKAPPETVQALAATGRAHQRNNSAVNLVLVRDLIGKSVVNRERAKLGEVIDVLAAMDSSVPAYLLMSPAKLSGGGDYAFAVPLSRLRIEDSGKLVFGGEASALASARKFDDSLWRNGGYARKDILHYPLKADAK